MPRGPNDKQRAFILAYLACLNGAQAAIQAGYSRKRAKITAAELLRKPHVRQEIDRLIDASFRMSGAEVIARLERQADATIALFLKPGTLELDPEALHEHGDLVSSFWMSAEGPRIRLHDSQKALELLGKTRALFVERAILSDLEGMDIVESDHAETPSNSRSAASRSPG